MKKKKPGTRKQVLESGEKHTILSRRVYRIDALATVALWAREGALWPLTSIADALRRPTYVLYAGRKSNPLGLPLNPLVIEAGTLADAFGKRPPLDGWQLEQLGALRPRGGWGREVAHDPVEGFGSGLVTQRRETRRDASLNRLRWQFEDRVVEVSVLPEPIA